MARRSAIAASELVWASNSGPRRARRPVGGFVAAHTSRSRGYPRTHFPSSTYEHMMRMQACQGCDRVLPCGTGCPRGETPWSVCMFATHCTVPSGPRPLSRLRRHLLWLEQVPGVTLHGHASEPQFSICLSRDKADALLAAKLVVALQKQRKVLPDAYLHRGSLPQRALAPLCRGC